ncbi:MAG TPA: hypothetical protein VMT29_10070 [Steroidobacteraceae bacterium]|nr:hypothetical protein [Steroidobacteraceae bacterium]
MRPARSSDDFCAKMNLTTKQTGDDFDLGTGFNTIFNCVPRQ